MADTKNEKTLDAEVLAKQVEELKAQLAEAKAEAKAGAKAAPKAKDVELTKPGSHVATQRGYAKGQIIEPGRPVPADVPVSENWMKTAPKKAKADEDDAE